MKEPKRKTMDKRRRWISIIILIIGSAATLLSTMNINDLALSALGSIKKLTGNDVRMGELAGVDQSISHEVWDSLLVELVDPDGRVNYRGFLDQRDHLGRYLDLLTSNPPSRDTWSDNEQLAYWINAYNAFTVELILDHYPVESIKDIGGNIPMVNSPWDLKFFSIGGVKFDLNTIEHEILRKQFNEPRIHFAINCASVSCPKLLDKAYTAEALDEQLQSQAIDFFTNPEKNVFTENEARLSPIFDWFKSDFTRDGSLVDYLNRYSPTPLTKDTRISFLDYDWNLNE